MYLNRYQQSLPVADILALRDQQEEELLRITHWDRHRELLRQFPEFSAEEVSWVDGNVFEIAASTSFEEQWRPYFHSVVEGLLPWRKGPFRYFGQDIDAEWRSDKKWDRLEPHLPELRGRRVGDIGCNNGYYLLRLKKYHPELLLGFDPSSRCYYQFDLFKRVLPFEELHFELFGIEHLDLYRDFFDVLFCLGVIYHRRDPYTACRQLFESLRPNGTLFLESLIYPGEDPIAFCPPDRYAKMRNVWYLPTVSCLVGWIEKAGFTNIEVLSTVTITHEEQRKTTLAPYESLADFLDANDETKTVEGLPAPTRTIVKAQKEG